MQTIVKHRRFAVGLCRAPRGIIQNYFQPYKLNVDKPRAAVEYQRADHSIVSCSPLVHLLAIFRAKAAHTQIFIKSMQHQNHPTVYIFMMMILIAPRKSFHFSHLLFQRKPIHDTIFYVSEHHHYRQLHQSTVDQVSHPSEQVA